MIDLSSWTSDMNFKSVWGNIEDIKQALNEFQTLCDAGNLNELQLMKFEEWRSDNLAKYENMNSVILIAYSTSGKTRQVIFDLDGLKVTALLPPCYGDGGQSWQYEMTIEKSLSDYFSDYGYKVKRLAGPYKNLAAKLGLGKYGRNNLMYIEGFGSYIRMVGFVTDAELIPSLSLRPNSEKK